MIRALLLADDMTGALDSGVQLVAHGVKTEVYIDDSNLDFTNSAADVIVVNTESRHLKPRKAARKISAIVGIANNNGISRIFKKTDSVLRGNVAVELAALAAESGEVVYFAPAYPQAGRTTKDGIHFLDGVPVDRTAFARDPFTPVKTARIADMFAKTDIRLKTFKPDQIITGSDDHDSPESKNEVVLIDAATDDDMRHIANSLKMNRARAIAGCAGMAYYLPYIWDLPVSFAAVPQPPSRLIIVSGSVNPVSLAQINYTRQKGFPVITLSAQQKLDQNYLDSDEAEIFLSDLANICNNQGRLVIEAIDSSDPENPILDGPDAASYRLQTADNIARITVRLMTTLPKSIFFLIGGDTLAATLRQLSINKIYPLAEISTGVVLSRLKNNDSEAFIISKSGGLGENDILYRSEDLIKQLITRERQGECPCDQKK